MFSRLFILLVVSLGTYAQKVELKGQVTDLRNEALAGVTITLSDSSRKMHSFTDEKGYFTLQIFRGNYMLEASFIGFERQQITVEINEDSCFYTLRLKEAVFELQETIVRGIRPPVRFEGSKTIVSPAASVLMAQSDGFTVVKNLPGVFASEEGGIRLSGQSGVTIQVDGKTIYLAGIALVNFLKSLSPGSIEEVEIIANPDASADASAKGGIINIILKRDHPKNLQLNSYLNYQQSRNSRSDWGANVLYGRANTGWGIDYSGGFSERLKTVSLSRKVENGPNTQQSVWLLNQDKIHNLRIFSDFKIGKTISLDLSGSTHFYSRSIPGSSVSSFYSEGHSPDSVLNTRSFSTYNQLTYSGGMRGKYKNDRKQVLSVTAHWFTFTHKESLAMSGFMDKASFLEKDTLKGNFGDAITSRAFQADWASPINKTFNFQSGIKQSLLSIENHATYRNNEDMVLEESVRYGYRESILAAYMQTSGSYKKWSFSGGLRMESTGINGRTYLFSTSSDTSYNLNYVRFFPSANLSYKWNENQQLTINYGHFITRPNYRDLSPSGYIVDKYTMVTGNAALQPELTHSFSLTYVPIATLRSSLSYSVSNGTIGQVFLSRENGGLLITSQNMASRRTWAFRVDGFGYVVSKFWRPAASITGLYSENRWFETDAEYKSIRLSPMFNLNNSFVFGKDWNAEFTAYYNGRLALGQIEVPAVWSVSCGVAKKLLNKRATIRLFANDIFASIGERAVFSSGLISGTSNLRYEETYVGFSFVYAFLKGKQKDTGEQLINKDSRINY